MEKEKLILASDLKQHSDYIVDYVMSKEESKRYKDYLKEIVTYLIDWSVGKSDRKVAMLCRCPICNRFPIITYKEEHNDQVDPFCSDYMRINIECSTEHNSNHIMPGVSIAVRYNKNDPKKIYEGYIQKAEMDLIDMWNDTCAFEKMKSNEMNNNGT